MRLAILALLLILTASFAAVVKADVRATKDTGNENLPKMNIGIMIDCDSKALLVEPKSNATGEPIPSASTYLFYTDYEYALVGSGSTNSSGVSKINVVGNQDYLTALFILRVDKAGFRSRETEFTYKYCFQDPPPDIGGSGNEPPPPPDLKMIEIEIKPVCTGTSVTGHAASVKSDGAPLQGAFVSVEDVSPAKKITSGETNAAGQFIFPGCGGDEYSVRASKGGYESKEVNVILTMCNDCPLPPPPPPPPPPPANSTGGNNTGGANQTGGQKPPPSEAPSSCPLGLLLLSVIALRTRV